MKIKNILMSAAMVGTLASCNMDEVYYSETVLDNFVESEASVYQLLARPLYHWQVFIGTHLFQVNEFMGDAFICPARSTNDWYNGGEFMARHYHTMDWQEGTADTNWKEAMQGVARCITVMENLDEINYLALGMTEENKAAHKGQMQALMGYFYMMAMDWYGGVPIYESTTDPLKPRATAQETFNLIEGLFKNAVAGLPARKSVDQVADGFLTKGAAAGLLARLYFNAESYIGKSMWNEAATLCQDIIDGKYGPYELDSDWRKVFGFDNKSAKGILWACPADYAFGKNDWYINNFYPYATYKYLGINTGFSKGCYNGYCLTPSRNQKNERYFDVNPEIKVGSPYESFDDGDLRKKLYRYLGNGEYEGMFFIGELKDPDHPERWATKERPWHQGQVVNIVDRVAPYSQLKSEGGDKYNSVDELPSTMYYSADEDDGVRLVKYPIPDEEDYKLYGTCYNPYLRISEIYLMLAECKYRLGDAQTACNLINKVRAIYFTGGADPNPATTSNLDKYRFLKEWLIEFLGEGRRRTDLIRWGAFHTEAWWDHEPTNDPNVCRMPVGDQVIGSNNLIKQNPGYGGEELAPDEI
ncbi:MAG: RagB/SusD family nutrient uptake outer membrane protein [Muribaculaceae bacterium]|nr:RagB/SusD family nutrient uptake outer membrane protein [Muribaculaceae bacterium]